MEVSLSLYRQAYWHFSRPKKVVSMSTCEKSNGNCATRIGFLASWQRPRCVGLLLIRGCESCGCDGAQRGTLSPEPPGIFRFAVEPAGGRPAQLRPPKPAVFESTTALGLLPSRALSSVWTPRTLPPQGFWFSPRYSTSFPPERVGGCFFRSRETIGHSDLIVHLLGSSPKLVGKKGTGKWV